MGKTSFANQLANRVNSRVLHLSRFLRSRKIAPLYDHERDVYIVDLTKASMKVEEYLNDSREKKIIIEGHLSHLIVSKPMVSFVFVLRCHPIILRDRLKTRGYPLRKMKENLTAEFLDSCLSETVNNFSVDQICEIDTTDIEISKAVDHATKILKDIKKPSSVYIDWISVIQKEGSLISFLKYLE